MKQKLFLKRQKKQQNKTYICAKNRIKQTNAQIFLMHAFTLNRKST